MSRLTPEIIAKAKTAKTGEELMAIAKDNGVELTKEQAQNFMKQLYPPAGELTDDELDNVSGGGCAQASSPPCPACGSTSFSSADCVRICNGCGRCG